jgi:sugar/nucleoside kinase (ribokinase family)
MKELLCIGNALLDGFAEVDEAFVRRFALSEPVCHRDYAQVSALLGAASQLRLCAGGGAATVAKHAARLGIRASFVGALGTQNQTPDTHAQLFVQDLAAAGVKVAAAYKPVPTGLCLFLHNKTDGENRIVACPSAAAHLQARDIPEARYASACLIVIDGYMLGRTDLVAAALAAAKRQNVPVALDTGSAAHAAAYAQDIIRYCRDYPLMLFMNEAEAHALCPSLSETERTEFFIRLSAHGKFPIIVVKLAHRGVLVYSGGALERVPTVPLAGVLTVGAGDTFCAGFLSAFIRGGNAGECARLGNETAGFFLKERSLQNPCPPSFHSTS